jgi:hypothetical protein
MSDQTRPNGQTRPDMPKAQQDAQTGPVVDQSQPDAQAEPKRRVSVREAAQLLDTTVEGIRSRIKRGSLDSMKVQGAVYVLLTPEQIAQSRPDAQAQPDSSGRPDDARAHADDPSLHRLADEQRDMITWLKREVERKDTIIMQMAQRIPELEPASNGSSDASGAPQTVPEQRGDSTSYPNNDKDPEKPSWWRRFFGFE